MSSRFLSFSCALVLCSGLMLAVAPAASADTGDPTAVVATVQGLNVSVSWTADTDPTVTDYLVSTVPASPTADVPADATSATLTGVRPGIDYQVSVSAVRSGAQGNPVDAAATVRTAAPGGSFIALPPSRILDTRSGLGGPKGATTSVSLQVTGNGGVPSADVSAVALNITVTQPVSLGYVTVYPTGSIKPVASNVDYQAKQTVANLVIVPVGAGGKVTLYSPAKTHLIADVSGYFTTAATASPTSGLFHAVQPTRLMDTRNGLGASTPNSGQQVKIKVMGAGGVPATNVSAVVLNTTVVASTTSGYLTAYPTGFTRPTASTIDFAPKQVVANRTIVPVGSDGSVNFYNSSGKTPILVDVTGWFTSNEDDSATGSYFVSLPPTRVVDTRSGLGAPKAPLGGDSVLAVTISGAVAGGKAVPAVTAAMPAIAAVTTVTFVNVTSPTYGTVYPSLTSRPLASDLDAPVGVSVPNLSLSGLGNDGKLAIYNSAGKNNVVVDLSGYFIGEIHVPTSTLVLPANAVTAVAGDTGATATITLAAGTPIPAIGQILTSTATPLLPGGLLVKVVSIATNGAGLTVVTTAPATLQEAIGSGELSISAPLSGTDVLPAKAGQRAKVLSAAELGERQSNPAAATPVTGPAKKSLCSGDAGSSIDTSFSIEPTLNVDIKLGWHFLSPTVEAKAYAEIKQTASAGFHFGGKVTCNWDTVLGQFTFPTIVFSVGPVPVVIIPELTIKLQANISGQATISSSVTQQFTAKAGLAYDGSSVTPINEISNSLTFQPLALTQANAKASVSLVAELIGKFYGLAGPSITVTATLTGTVDLLATPWWSLIFTLTASAALNFDVSIIHLSISTPEFTLYRKVLAQAGGNPVPGSSVTITFDEFALFSPIQTEYQSRGIVFGGANVPFITSDGANPTSPVLSGGAGFGDPLNATFVNPDGSARTVSTFTLDVGYIDEPGSTEVLAYDSNGKLLVTAVANLLGIDRITITHPGIGFFLVRSTGVEDSGWAIDNVKFSGFTPAAGGAAVKQPSVLKSVPAGRSTRGR